MTDIGIVIIAIVVFIAGFCLILAKAAKRKDSTMSEVMRRRAEDEERKRLFWSPENRTKRQEEYLEMQRLREGVGAPVLDLPDDHQQ